MDSHQRRKFNRATRRTSQPSQIPQSGEAGTTEKSPLVEQRPQSEVNFSHNLGDSIAILSVILAILLSIFAPTLSEKVIGLVIAAIGCIYLSYKSFWTTNLSKGFQSLGAIVFAVIILGGGGWHLYNQYFRPSISLEAFVSLGHTKGDNVAGFAWPDARFYDIRVVIGNISTEYSVQNIDLTVRVLDKSGDIFWGMGQISSIPGVEFTVPQISKDLRVRLRGTDGKDYVLSTQDMSAEIPNPAGDHWGVFCSRLPREQNLRLALASIHQADETAPQKLRIVGTYELVSSEGAKIVAVDKTLDVKR